MVAMLCLSTLFSASPVEANEVVTRPIQDWTGSGTIDFYDVLYYNVFMFDPMLGYNEWPRDSTGGYAYSASNCTACHN